MACEKALFIEREVIHLPREIHISSTTTNQKDNFRNKNGEAGGMPHQMAKKLSLLIYRVSRPVPTSNKMCIFPPVTFNEG